MSCFKIYFGNDIRRIYYSLSFEEFVNELYLIYPTYYPNLEIKYYDSDGDKIVVSSQLEWEEMLELNREQVIKIYIEEKNSRTGFKEGSDARVIDFPLLFDRLREKAMNCLETFDKDIIQKGKQFLLSIVNDKNVPDLLNREIDEFKKIVEIVDESISSLNEDSIKISEISSLNLCPDNSQTGSDSTQTSTSSFYDSSSLNMNDSNLSDVPILLETNNLDSVNFENVPEQKEVEIDLINSEVQSNPFNDILLKWGDKIELIKGMGFIIDSEVLGLLLEQTGGNHEEVVNLLLQRSNYQ
jgi:hypothetical protein